MPTQEDLFADIWGSPDKAEPSTRRSTTPSKRPHDAADEMDVDQAASTKRSRWSRLDAELPPHLNAMFEDGDEDDGFDFAPLESIDKLTREAEARHAGSVAGPSRSKPNQSGNNGSSRAPIDVSDGDGAMNDPTGITAAVKGAGKDGEPKKRKPIPKLDESRLLGDYGFRALMPVAKKFKPKGKGHETQDLARVLEMYQLWAHRMYPKMQFRDTVERVEKLCHSRRMTTHLSVWKDEDNNGRLTDRQNPDEPGNIHVDGSDEEEEAHSRTIDAEGRPVPMTLPPARTAASTASSRPPSMHDDDDLDDLIAGLPQQNSTKPQSRPREDDEFDEDMWDIADEIHLGGSQRAKNPAKGASENPPPVDDEDEMWMDLARQTGGDEALTGILDRASPFDLAQTEDYLSRTPVAKSGPSVIPSPTLNGSADSEDTSPSKTVATEATILLSSAKPMRPILDSDLGDLYD